MTSFVTSADGTRIVFDHLGDGDSPPVIVIGGLFCARPSMQPLCEQLAQAFTVINYDRRGRGESGDMAPYAVEREVEDVAALIAEAGGTAAVYGHSSGAGLGLNAAAAGLPITRLVLHEPPYGGADEESRRSARELTESVKTAIAEDRRSHAIELFFAASGMPPEMVEGMSHDPGMLAVAPTMPYDFAVMGEDTSGGTIPEGLARSITIPTLVLAGSASPDFFQDAATRLAQLVPHAHHTLLDSQDHAAAPEVVAPVVAKFLSG